MCFDNGYMASGNLGIHSSWHIILAGSFLTGNEGSVVDPEGISVVFTSATPLTTSQSQ